MSFRDSSIVDVILFPEMRKALTGGDVLIKSVTTVLMCNEHHDMAVSF